MKGAAGGSSYNLPAKRRWKGLVVAVLGLVFLSMLVPLVFLLGLHSGFHSYSGYSSEQGSSDSVGLQFHNSVIAQTRNKSKEDQSRHVDDLIRRLGPTIPKVYKKNSDDEAKNKTHVLPLPPQLPQIHLNTNSTGSSDKGDVADAMSRDRRTLCELKFGSYCLWRQEHKDTLKDSTVKKMKDLLYVARAYYPSIAKLPALDKLSHELKQNIQEFERILSEATTDKDLPPLTKNKMEKMESVVARAKSFPVDCNNVDKKFRQLVDLTEDEANFHMKQSAFLFQLAIQTMPKSLHCLSMRLTVEYFRSTPPDLDSLLKDKFLNPELQHYVIFSNNVLASSAVINSTVMNAKDTSSQVFHVLTDAQNYFAMKLWFSLNKYLKASVQVLDIEGLKLKDHYKVSNFNWLMPQEFRVSFHGVDKISRASMHTEYVSTFSHSHFLLPDIFQRLKKVVILDDDIIVQRDLSALWSLDLGGKVNGALMLCRVRLSQLKNYLRGNSFDKDSCAWMSGVNVIDLDRWRDHDLTKTYQSFVNEQLKTKEGLSEAVVLRATLLTFQGHVYALDDSWVLSGLGYNYGLDNESIKKAAVLHFNGNMKPWLELGIPKYKGFWRNYLISESSFLSACNVNQ